MTSRIEKLRSISTSSERESPSMVEPRSTQAGLSDRAVLNREIEAILREAAGTLPVREMIEDHMLPLILAARRGQVKQTAERVISLLSLNLDDLRKAALLSLIVRLTGKRKFDPVAAYVLEKRATYVTSQG